ncbi:hypothetical protein PoB_006129000, partial [Plakobranchus ocellatus]
MLSHFEMLVASRLPQRNLTVIVRFPLPHTFPEKPDSDFAYFKLRAALIIVSL